jgi:hypothetical protein
MKIRRLDKLPKRKVTVDELLDLADIQDIVNEILAARDEINDLFVIYTKGDQIYWMSNGMKLSRSVYLLEVAKKGLLSEHDK